MVLPVPDVYPNTRSCLFYTISDTFKMKAAYKQGTKMYCLLSICDLNSHSYFFFLSLFAVWGIFLFGVSEIVRFSFKQNIKLTT